MLITFQGSPANSPKVTDDTGQAAPTLATDGNKVYAIFANGDIIAIDMDGNKVWSTKYGQYRKPLWSFFFINAL